MCLGLCAKHAIFHTGKNSSETPQESPGETHVSLQLGLKNSGNKI